MLFYQQEVGLEKDSHIQGTFLVMEMDKNVNIQMISGKILKIGIN